MMSNDKLVKKYLYYSLESAFEWEDRRERNAEIVYLKSIRDQYGAVGNK